MNSELGHWQKYWAMPLANWTWSEMKWQTRFSIDSAACCALLLAVRRLLFAAVEARNRRSFFSCLVTSLLLCFFPSFSPPQDSNPPILPFARNPDPAPDFKLTSLDGKPVTLADSHGKVILLNFWATWCGPCRAEIPDLVELQNKYKDRLQILGLVVDDDDQDAIKEFTEKFRINYPVALATNEIRIQYRGLAALPTSVVLDAQGRHPAYRTQRGPKQTPPRKKSPPPRPPPPPPRKAPPQQNPLSLLRPPKKNKKEK